MSTKQKLNVLLAITDTLAPSFKKGIVNYGQFFKDKQGAFLGEKKTYDAKPDTIDEPSMRGNVLVQTTVKEKLDYLVESSKDYINALFSQEKTNASGLAVADVVVDGEVLFSQLTSAELLRLKSLFSTSEIEAMYSNLPVRSDAEVWVETKNDMYPGREVFEGPLQEGVKKSTTKVQYILEDPNVAQLKDTSKYIPVTATRDTTTELGDYTHQRFTGATSQTKRAEILKRRTKLLTAITEALKTANEIETVQSTVTAEKIFGFLHDGTI
jgi:hypothetical protein